MRKVYILFYKEGQSFSVLGTSSSIAKAKKIAYKFILDSNESRIYELEEKEPEGEEIARWSGGFESQGPVLYLEGHDID
jgi:rRNA processing protein Krr1/Pno1